MLFVPDINVCQCRYTSKRLYLTFCLPENTVSFSFTGMNALCHAILHIQSKNGPVENLLCYKVKSFLQLMNCNLLIFTNHEQNSMDFIANLSLEVLHLFKLFYDFEILFICRKYVFYLAIMILFQMQQEWFILALYWLQFIPYKVKVSQLFFPMLFLFSHQSCIFVTDFVIVTYIMQFCISV